RDQRDPRTIRRRKRKRADRQPDCNGRKQRGCGQSETPHVELPVIIRHLRLPLLLTAAALSVAILMTWPPPPGLGPLGRTPNSGDARFSVWNVAWVAHALTTNPADVFNANIYHPH